MTVRLNIVEIITVAKRADLRLGAIKHIKKEGYNMAKFKVGDRVKIINKRGFTWNRSGEMDKWMGRTMTIKTDNNGRYSMIEDGGKWLWIADDFEAKITPHSIHITTDGNIVHAILKDDGEIVKRSRAMCAPSDTFDFEVGAKLAFDRLFAAGVRKDERQSVHLYCFKDCNPGEWFTKGKTYTIDADDRITTDDGYRVHAEEYRRNYRLCGGYWNDFLVPEVKRPAKIGDWVRITKEPLSQQPYPSIVHKGSIVKIEGIGLMPSIRSINEHDWAGFREDEYVVLENYTPPKEPEKPKYYSGKVVCVACNKGYWGDCIDAGKVYRVEYGRFINNNGGKSSQLYTDVPGKNEPFVHAEFIEFKGECTGK